MISPMDASLNATASTIINATVAQVWHALVTPDLIKRYMFGATVVSDWRPGGDIVWKGEWKGKPYEDRGVILRQEPGRALSYSHWSPLSGQPDTPDNRHTVTIELSGEGGRTHVKLEQDNNKTPDERDHSQKNWTAMLAEMKKVVESGPA
jgi:uncharacterized protein YndB with AHSA1/START domain